MFGVRQLRTEQSLVKLAVEDLESKKTAQRIP